MSLTRDAIFAAKFERFKVLRIPEWGGEVWIKAMSAGERDDFEASHRALKDSGHDPLRHLRARLACATVCDEDGNRIFQDADVDRLSDHPASALDRIADVAMELCGMKARDAEALAAELKNARAASSPSA